MAAQAPSALAPVVTLSQNRAVTTSKDVADCFGKHHRDVLRAIENLMTELDEEHQRNFALMSISVEIGNGATRQSPVYEMTRDGFTLLAMGFTGKKALDFKVAYIDAFNRMEAELKAIAPQTVEHILNTTIGTDGFHVLGSLVSGKVKKLRGSQRRAMAGEIWAQVRKAFGVSRGEDIPVEKMDAARNFIAAYAVEGEWQARDEIKQEFIHHDAQASIPAEALRNSRWLLSFDDEGKTAITAIPHDACVMNPETMLKAISRNEIRVSRDLLAKFAVAALASLWRDNENNTPVTRVSDAFPPDVQAAIDAHTWHLTEQAYLRIAKYVDGSVRLCAGHGQDVSRDAAMQRIKQITLEDALTLSADEMVMVLGMADHIAGCASNYANAVRNGLQALLERGMVIGPMIKAA